MPEEGIGQAKQSDRVDGVDKVGCWHSALSK